jgi:DNA-binding response OmpR family regulator
MSEIFGRSLPGAEPPLKSSSDEAVEEETDKIRLRPETQKIKKSQRLKPAGEDAERSAKPDERAPRRPPVVVIVEPDAGLRAHLTAVLERSRSYPVAVADRAGLERALRVHDVTLAVLSREANVEPLEARELLDAAGRGGAEVRRVPDYGAALFGELVEYDRMLSFVADLVEQLERAVAAAVGGRPGLTRRAARQAKVVAERLRQPRRVADAAFLAAMLVALEPVLARLRAKTGADAPDLALAGSTGVISALVEGTAAPLGLRSILGALAADPRSPTADPIATRIARAVRAHVEALEEGDAASAQATLRARSNVDLDPEVVEAVLAVSAGEAALEKLGPERPEVALVDANTESTTLLELRLANRGYDPRTYRDGKKALAAFGARKPALIIADVATPGMDGYTLLLKVRASPVLRGVPFVFLTDRSDPASVTKAIELGADDFFQKPVNPDIFFAKAGALVAKSRARAAPAAEGVQGRIEEMPLPDLVQVLAGAQRTVRLDIDAGERHGELRLVGGKLLEATVDELVGNEAAIEMFLWQKGRFEIRSDDSACDANITESLDYLLLEAARRMDESKR